MNKKNRKLVLRRLENIPHEFALFDRDSGEVLAAQVCVDIKSNPRCPVRVVVTFEEFPGSDDLIIEP